ncbi:flagellar protein FlaG [Micavibrio aeruginosavorus]|uniref:flagellar protein FlaG n=1 Tax=Micavibrio aeruginosavorus TaxID=349221 RepID=UPI001F3B9E86|nr:flagellar protein FlaG [Micavibrio aeruginosavorus]
MAHRNGYTGQEGMIEAVNSVLSNAPLIRGSTEQQSTSRTQAANPDKVQVVAQAPYISPYVHVDVNHDRAVLQLRDPDTGDVVRQIPSEPMLDAMRRQDATLEARRVAQAEESARENRVQQVSQPVQQQVQVQQPAPQTQAPTPTQQQFAAFASAANFAAASQPTTTVSVLA